MQTDNVLESTSHIEPADAISNLMSCSTVVFLFSCVSYFSLHIESDFFCSFCAKDVICGAILFLCIKDVPVNCYQCVLEKCRSKENSKGKFSVTVITVGGEQKNNLRSCFFSHSFLSVEGLLKLCKVRDKIQIFLSSLFHRSFSKIG